MKRIEMIKQMETNDLAKLFVYCMNPDEKYADFEYISPTGSIFYAEDAAIEDAIKWLEREV